MPAEDIVESTETTEEASGEEQSSFDFVLDEETGLTGVEGPEEESVEIPPDDTPAGRLEGPVEERYRNLQSWATRVHQENLEVVDNQEEILTENRELRDRLAKLEGVVETRTQPKKEDQESPHLAAVKKQFGADSDEYVMATMMDKLAGPMGYVRRDEVAPAIEMVGRNTEAEEFKAANPDWQNYLVPMQQIASNPSLPRLSYQQMYDMAKTFVEVKPATKGTQGGEDGGEGPRTPANQDPQGARNTVDAESLKRIAARNPDTGVSIGGDDLGTDDEDAKPRTAREVAERAAKALGIE